MPETILGKRGAEDEGIDDNVTPRVKRQVLSLVPQAADHSRPDPVLFASEDQKVFVLDIPASLEHAQNFRHDEVARRIFSIAAKDEPFRPGDGPSVKGAKSSGWRVEYRKSCQGALEVAQTFLENHAACSPRIPSDLAGNTSARTHSQMVKDLPTTFFNPSASMAMITPVSTVNGGPSFRVPSGAAFSLGYCENTTQFVSIARQYSPPSGRMDFIMLDPPWLNASADRKGDYKTSDFYTLKHLLLDMDLDNHLKPDSFLAVWVTNSEAARNIVLGRGGLFQRCGVSLFEEWIWLKVAGNGKPLFPLNSVGREPYEALLIGKKIEISDKGDGSPSADPIKRVILAVPDLHSRKPSLKVLVERCLFPGFTPYRACEVFARNLTADWLAWGDECIKFNSSLHWTRG